MQVNTQYKVNDILLYYQNGELLFDKVISVRITCYPVIVSIEYLIGGHWRSELEVGNTKQELVNKLLSLEPKEFNEPPF